MCISKFQHMTGRKTSCNRSRPVFFGFLIFRQTSQLATEKIQNLCNRNRWSCLSQLGSVRFRSFFQSSELDLWTLREHISSALTFYAIMMSSTSLGISLPSLSICSQLFNSSMKFLLSATSSTLSSMERNFATLPWLKQGFAHSVSISIPRRSLCLVTDIIVLGGILNHCEWMLLHPHFSTTTSWSFLSKTNHCLPYSMALPTSSIHHLARLKYTHHLSPHPWSSQPCDHLSPASAKSPS